MPEDVRIHYAHSAIDMALEKDRGVHEGLVSSFEWNGRTWSVIVDLQEAWVKIMSEQDLEQVIRDTVRKN